MDLIPQGKHPDSYNIKLTGIKTDAFWTYSNADKYVCLQGLRYMNKIISIYQIINKAIER